MRRKPITALNFRKKKKQMFETIQQDPHVFTYKQLMIRQTRAFQLAIRFQSTRRDPRRVPVHGTATVRLDQDNNTCIHANCDWTKDIPV